MLTPGSVPAGPDRPLSLAEAAALLSSLRGAPAVLLAVSGGPDSTALLHLAAAAAAADPAFPRLAVATVDHGLRPEARHEAEAVARAAAALGLPHHLLAWDGAKPRTRLQERAREGRYALLVACARGIGATHLVTAHTLDDQAETVLFRLLRGSGVAGLAGMAAAVTREGILHLRPFLGVPKARLVAACRAEGWRFATDPSNADPRFARPRLRALMPALAAEGLGADRLATLARRMAEAEAALAGAARRTAAEALRPDGASAASAWLAAPAALRHRMLDLLLEQAAPAGGRPRLDRLERLSEALAAAVAAGVPFGATLRGVLVRFDGADGLSFAPAPPRRAPPGGAGADPGASLGNDSATAYIQPRTSVAFGRGRIATDAAKRQRTTR